MYVRLSPLSCTIEGGGQPALEVVLVSSFLQWPAAGSVQCKVGSEPIEQDK